MIGTTYLGDAVYASFDGYHVVLRTGDGNNQQIFLDPSVFSALIAFEKDARAKAVALANAAEGIEP